MRRPHKIGTQSQLEGFRVSSLLWELVDKGSFSEPLYRLVEFLTFLGQLHKNQEVHLLALDTGLVTHPSLQEWLSAHARYHVHHVPVDSRFNSASVWVRMVERWLTEISREGRRPGRETRNVQDLFAAIGDYVEKGDREIPFVWWARPRGRFQSRGTDGRSQGMTLKFIAMLKVMIHKSAGSVSSRLS